MEQIFKKIQLLGLPFDNDILKKYDKIIYDNNSSYCFKMWKIKSLTNFKLQLKCQIFRHELKILFLNLKSPNALDNANT